MISASFMNTLQQNADCSVILMLFFVHLMEEHTYYGVRNKISN